MPSKKRAELEPPKPVSYKGTRYEAVTSPALRGLDADCGYVAAYDETDGTERWVEKIYQSDLPEDMEDDKRNVRIARLALKGWLSRKLLIVDERGNEFELNLETRQVKAL